MMLVSMPRSSPHDPDLALGLPKPLAAPPIAAIRDATGWPLAMAAE